MTLTVQTFVCPRCRRGEFRSLPGPDGKAYCPWCGDAVAGSDAPPAPEPPAAPPPPPPALPPPDPSVPALREELAEQTRRRERAEADLRQELEKKKDIKQAVMGEMGRLAAQLGEARDLLRRKEEEHRALLADAARWKEDLERQLRKAVEEEEKNTRTIDELRKEDRKTRAALDVARRDADQIRAHLEAARAGFDAEIAGMRKTLAEGEARLGAVKAAEAELSDLKARLKDQRRLLEKEREESRAKAAAHQAELEKRDQRIHELQALIKTLGERLNDLARRHHV